MNKKLMRCNNPVGFIPGNRKGYCKNRGIVATVTENGRVTNFCQRCWDKRCSSSRSKPNAAN